MIDEANLLNRISGGVITSYYITHDDQWNSIRIPERLVDFHDIKLPLMVSPDTEAKIRLMKNTRFDIGEHISVEPSALFADEPSEEVKMLMELYT